MGQSKDHPDFQFKLTEEEEIYATEIQVNENDILLVNEEVEYNFGAVLRKILSVMRITDVIYLNQLMT